MLSEKLIKQYRYHRAHGCAARHAYAVALIDIKSPEVSIEPMTDHGWADVLMRGVPVGVRVRVDVEIDDYWEEGLPRKCESRSAHPDGDRYFRTEENGPVWDVGKYDSILKIRKHLSHLGKHGSWVEARNQVLQRIAQVSQDDYCSYMICVHAEGYDPSSYCVGTEYGEREINEAVADFCEQNGIQAPWERRVAAAGEMAGLLDAMEG